MCQGVNTDEAAGMRAEMRELRAEITQLRMENAALRRALEVKAINDNKKITGYDVTECKP